MGSQSQPNHSLLIGAMILLLDLIDKDAKEAARLDLVLKANELWKGGCIC